MIGGGGMRAASDGIDKSSAIDNVCQTFRSIGERAERRGVITCFEALNRFETQIGRSFSEVCGYRPYWLAGGEAGRRYLHIDGSLKNLMPASILR